MTVQWEWYVNVKSLCLLILLLQLNHLLTKR